MTELKSSDISARSLTDSSEINIVSHATSQRVPKFGGVEHFISRTEKVFPDPLFVVYQMPMLGPMLTDLSVTGIPTCQHPSNYNCKLDANIFVMSL